jgi:hypothetical protein
MGHENNPSSPISFTEQLRAFKECTEYPPFLDEMASKRYMAPFNE